MATNRIKSAVSAAVLMSALTACSNGIEHYAPSDTYFDRRDTVHLTTGNANASNIAVQTIDPWPRHAANRNIATNGEKIQPAIQRYKEGKVTQPRGLGTSSIEISTNPGSNEQK
jgi:hypothetical protein